jgi:hypothetical protein
VSSLDEGSPCSEAGVGVPVGSFEEKKDANVPSSDRSGRRSDVECGRMILTAPAFPTKTSTLMSYGVTRETERPVVGGVSRLASPLLSWSKSR